MCPLGRFGFAKSPAGQWVSKYADHCPLYRQSRILICAGIEIHRTTLADWVGNAAFHLEPMGIA
ncbi:hypothetical protein AVO44_05715 [Ruegeria profundi]|uniref:Transposase IS66 central domain-containing protein n=1 Tax=Ruegeria profundi TaxID=1685378 RepID=A0A0X3U3D4_9RHOB|nr:hypothetical protein AVO44_05715 [Ruegeria profundi]